ncbi:TPA: hypothetical protein ACGJPB_003365 [Escherichia coli]|nr:hypothetical protein [Escherichia coli]
MSFKRLVIITAISCMYTGFAFAANVTLNPAQVKHLNNVINHEVKGKDDRNFVYTNWTEAQRVAEFICRPLALKELQKRYTDVDKVIFDQGKHNMQRLISPALLTGNGQYRRGINWTTFHFACELSVKTGEAMAFRLLRNKTLTMAPGPVIRSGEIGQ